jgi:hypothetical protein
MEGNLTPLLNFMISGLYLFIYVILGGLESPSYSSCHLYDLPLFTTQKGKEGYNAFLITPTTCPDCMEGGTTYDYLFSFMLDRLVLGWIVGSELPYHDSLQPDNLERKKEAPLEWAYHHLIIL